MKRLFNFIVSVIFICSLLFAGPGVSSQPNSTPVCALISVNTIWTAAASPYVVCSSYGVTINAGVTLTIQPGTTVQVTSGNGVHINVLGTLIANGTAAAPITFTALNPADGVWGGIWTSGSSQTPANLSLDYVNLSYAGVNNSGEGAVLVNKATVTIDHSTISNGAGNGVFVGYGDQITLNRTTFTNNGLNAVVLASPTGDDLLMTGLAASGNGSNVVRISSTTNETGQRHWVNPGIHYLIDGDVYNSNGDILTIDPGVTLEFAPTQAQLTIGGQLLAQGTPTAPILMTREANTSGYWRGLVVAGGPHQANAQLDYVTVEYAGSDTGGADIAVTSGNLIAHHSTIRNSQKDGINFGSGAGGTVLQSEISGNALYGMVDAPTNQGILAGQNYWGAADGPMSDNGSCPVGHGQKVTQGVFFSPIRTSADQVIDFPLSDAPILTLTPRAWFAPADGNRVYIDINLVDGNGHPLAGRQVDITSTLGTATGGGITDAFGNTFAYVTSSVVGDATITAQIKAATGCEGVVSPQVKITFTAPISGPDLFHNSQSPYMGAGITVSPMPVVLGVNTTITAKLVNPTAQAVTVDVTFGFVQASIGLAFGPIKTYTAQVVPANGSLVLTASFVPVVSGHYCVQVAYSITAIGNTPVQVRAVDPGVGMNLVVHHATTGDPTKPDNLDKTRNSVSAVSKFVSSVYRPNPFAIPLGVASAGLSMELNWADDIFSALNGDPPRQDYTSIATPVLISLPLIQPGNGITPAHAQALDDLQQAQEQANAYGVAADIALDRSGGAAEAGDIQWASTQTGVMLEYNNLFGAALITVADKIDALVTELGTEGIHSLIVTPADVTAMQADLSANGFSTQAIADAHALGMSDADLAAMKVGILGSRPEDLAGDLITAMGHVSFNYRQLGSTLEHPDNFNPGYSVTGGAPQQQTAGNVMAQVYDSTTTVQVGNPLPQAATINLSIRNISLPAGWTASVSPAQVTLDPGVQVTATVTVSAGTPVPQGSVPEVAVEGYANGVLLGGVTVQVVVPRYVPFDGKLRLYLPEVHN